jgi:hypothetical protein
MARHHLRVVGLIGPLLILLISPAAVADAPPVVRDVEKAPEPGQSNPNSQCEFHSADEECPFSWSELASRAPT